MIYLDTSCLLKLLFEEPESDAVRQAVAGEDDVVVSELTELETVVQLRAGWLGGAFRDRRYRAYMARVNAFRRMDPFRFVSLPGAVFRTALRQHGRSRERHLRSLDRLHLAAMEELGVRRLMTNDGTQAAGARMLGYEVRRPGQS